MADRLSQSVGRVDRRAGGRGGGRKKDCRSTRSLCCELGIYHDLTLQFCHARVPVYKPDFFSSAKPDKNLACLLEDLYEAQAKFETLMSSAVPLNRKLHNFVG